MEKESGSEVLGSAAPIPAFGLRRRHSHLVRQKLFAIVP